MPSVDAFVPYRTDYVGRLLLFLGQDNCLYAAGFTFLVCFVAVHFVGLATGQFWGKNGVPPMYKSVGDNFNLGVLTPVGAGLLCHFYLTLSHAVEYIQTYHLIPASQAASFHRIVVQAGRYYNSYIPIVAALVVSLVINGFNYLKKESWLSRRGGITAVYARCVVFINFFMIGVVLYKCAVTAWLLRAVFRLDISISLTHPDRAGGLAPVGDTTVAMSYFLLLIVTFVTLLVFFDRFARWKAVFCIIFVAIYCCVPILLYLPLFGAHTRMLAVKQTEIERVNDAYQYHYELMRAELDTPLHSVNEAQAVVHLRQMQDLVGELPEWPLDFRSIVRSLSVFALPPLVFLIEQLGNLESALWTLLIKPKAKQLGKLLSSK